MAWPADGGTSTPGNVAVQAIRTVTANGPVLTTDATILVNTAAGNLTLTLPAPPSCTGQRFTLKKISPDAFNFSLVGATIDGDPLGVVVMAQYEAVAVVSNGAVFFVLYRG